MVNTLTDEERCLVHTTALFIRSVDTVVDAVTQKRLDDALLITTLELARVARTVIYRCRTQNRQLDDYTDTCNAVYNLLCHTIIIINWYYDVIII